MALVSLEVLRPPRSPQPHLTHSHGISKGLAAISDFLMAASQFYVFQIPGPPERPGSQTVPADSSQIPGLVDIEDQVCEEPDHLDDALGPHSCRSLASASNRMQVQSHLTFVDRVRAVERILCA